MSTPGKFITLEGSEGAGKSTAMQAITSVLTEWGTEHIQTREPGGQANAERIRELLLHSDHLDDNTELLLMFAARNEHLVKTIRPALQQGTWVVSDRFADASFAYQGFGRQINWETIEYLENWIVGETHPDLTILLDVDPSEGLSRAAKRSAKDRIEKENLNFFNNIRKGYLKRLEQHPERIFRVDANQAIDQVALQIRQILHNHKPTLCP